MHKSSSNRLLTHFIILRFTHLQVIEILSDKFFTTQSVQNQSVRKHQIQWSGTLTQTLMHAITHGGCKYIMEPVL